MRNIIFISKEIGIPYKEVLEFPYAIFLSYLKHLRVMQIEQTEEGRQALYKEGNLYKTEPNFNRLRNLDGYTKHVKN